MKMNWFWMARTRVIRATRTCTPLDIWVKDPVSFLPKTKKPLKTRSNYRYNNAIRTWSMRAKPLIERIWVNNSISKLSITLIKWPLHNKATETHAAHRSQTSYTYQTNKKASSTMIRQNIKTIQVSQKNNQTNKTNNKNILENLIKNK